MNDSAITMRAKFARKHKRLLILAGIACAVLMAAPGFQDFLRGFSDALIEAKQTPNRS